MVDESLSNCTVSSLVQPAGGAANFSKMLLLNAVSLPISLPKVGNAKVEEESARAAERALKSCIFLEADLGQTDEDNEGEINRLENGKRNKTIESNATGYTLFICVCTCSCNDWHSCGTSLPHDRHIT